MNSPREHIFLKFAPTRWLIALLKKLLLPGFGGLSINDLLKTYFNGIVEGAFSARAGAIAFSFFMAIFPSILFLLNLIPYVPIENFQTTFLNFIYGLMPEQSVSFFQPVLNDIAQNQRGGLLSFAALFALILMANGVKAIFSSFERSFHIEINRGFFRQYFVALSVSIILALLLLTIIVVTIYLGYVLNSLREQEWVNGSTNLTLLFIGRSVFLIAMIYLAVTTLYYFGTKEGRHIKFFSAGAVMTTLLFILTTYLFGIYIDNFSSYNKLYGSIGALLIMMLYIWLNSNLLLLGFELNALLVKLKNNSKTK